MGSCLGKREWRTFQSLSEVKVLFRELARRKYKTFYILRWHEYSTELSTFNKECALAESRQNQFGEFQTYVGMHFFSIAAAVLSSFENPDKKCEKNLAVIGFSFYTSSSI